ncbi:MAG: right-handed parallel beta-helix repeat-containing protein [Anaerolineales bacterium]|nr:right-handed parallel beta-helix repeat-containing protein [Anaerolineales bacterium]
MKKKSVTFSFLFTTIFTLVLNGCGSSSSPAVPATQTATPPTLTPVLPTHTITPIPKGKSIIVTSADDSGTGTLRQALRDSKPGDAITFDPAIFPQDDPVSIAVTSELPWLSQGYITIDASNAGVILDGIKAQGEWVNGLTIRSDGNTIRGLQIIRFQNNGIELHGGRNNIIGGSRSIGMGPLGQGNLLSSNGGRGISLMEGASFNLISGNYIGTDQSGKKAWENKWGGIFMDGVSHNQLFDNLVSSNGGGSGVGIIGGSVKNTLLNNIIGADADGTGALGNAGAGISLGVGASENVIGPNNLIAYNGVSGIEVRDSSTVRNTITQNSIHDNVGCSIEIWNDGNTELAAPLVTEFDLGAGTVRGIACENCTVEIFSDNGSDGEHFEGQAIANSSGVFVLDKNSSFNVIHLTATATDINGNTSQLSVPTVSGSTVLQQGNNLVLTRLSPKDSKDIEDNRIGGAWHSLWQTFDLVCSNPVELLYGILTPGFKRFRVSFNGSEERMADWSKPEFSIDPNLDEFITTLAENDIKITYNLTFWDTATYPGGVGAPCPRFKNEEEIQRYLEYVSFMVSRYKDRIQYYEIWNEPDIPVCPQWIEVDDYINLVRRAVPVIRKEYPDAKIMVGGTSGLDSPASQDYLFRIIESDIMELVDVVSWHPFYGYSPESHPEYYYNYPLLVQEIKSVASTHGFSGEYAADELMWRPHRDPEDDHPWTYTQIVIAKYYARVIVMNLGMDVTTTVVPIPQYRPVAFPTVRNLSTIMAGAKPANLAVEIQSDAANIMSYGFSLPNGDQLIALWSNGIAVDDDPGIPSTLTIPGLTGWKVMGIDILNGFEQELISMSEDGNLLIRDFLLKDYPIFIRLSK